MEMLPEGVLKAAHVLPSYWFIKNNETLKTLETLNTEPSAKTLTIPLMASLFFTKLAIKNAKQSSAVEQEELVLVL